MKAIVTEIFKDKFTKELYKVGTEVDFDEDRIKDLSERNLVKVVEKPIKPARKTTKK